MAGKHPGVDSEDQPQVRKYLKSTVKVYFNDRKEIPGIRNRGRVQDLRRVNPRSRFLFLFFTKIRELRESGH